MDNMGQGLNSLQVLTAKGGIIVYRDPIPPSSAPHKHPSSGVTYHIIHYSSITLLFYPVCMREREWRGDREEEKNGPQYFLQNELLLQ